MTFRSGLVPVVLVLAGASAFLAASLLAASSTSADAPGPYAFRAVLPQVAGDDAAGTAVVATVTPTPPGAGCIGPRSAIRALADPDAGFSRTPADVSLAALLANEPPATAPAKRISPLEASVVRLQVFVEETRPAPGGGMEVLVAQAPGDYKIVAGMPGPDCMASLGTADADRGAINFARIAAISACGQPGKTNLGGKAVIEGVPHWSAGVSGSPVLSLWPVLSFALADGWTCQGIPPTATPTATPVPPIDVLILSIAPQTAARGQVVTVTAMPMPKAAGRECRATVFVDAELRTWLDLPGMTTKLTGVDGEASWELAIPETAATGQGKFQVSCDGGSNAVKVIVTG